MSYYDQTWNLENNVGVGRPGHFPERQILNRQNENVPLQNQRTPQLGLPPREQFQNYAHIPGTPFNNVGSSVYMPQQLQHQNPPQSLPPQHQMPPSLPPQHQMPPSLPPQRQMPPPQHQMPPSQHQMLPPQHQMPPSLPQQCQMPPPQHQMPQLQRQMPPPQMAPPQLRPPLPPPSSHSQLWPLPPSHSQVQQTPPSHSQLRPPTVIPSNRLSYPNFSMPPSSPTMSGTGQMVASQQCIGNVHRALSGLEINSQPPPMHSSFQQMPSYQPFPRMPTRGAQPDNFQHPRIKSTPQHEGINNPPLNTRSNICESDGKDLGSQRLENWLQIIGKSKKQQLKDPSKPKSSEQVWKPVNQFRILTQLITTMSTKLEELKDGASSKSAIEWKSMTLELETLKGQYMKLESLLDGSSVETIAKKLLRRRNKRAALKQARVRKFEEQQRMRETWAQKSQQIDQWQERHRAKIKEETLRKSRKATADRTLSKVTREIQDASRLIETMLALQKLRLIRRDAAEKRGETDLGESRQTFEQKIADMTRLVQSQLECYKEEEAKLKEIIKSEQDKDTEKDRLAQIEQEKQKQREEYDELESMLFGEQEKMTVSDPRFPYVQYYRQAETSLQAFVQIRHEWDSFLVPETVSTSSIIPSSWVFPEPPSSTVWASALK